jgi:hypothetical protein
VSGGQAAGLLLGVEDLLDEKAGGGVEAVSVGALGDRQYFLSSLQAQLGGKGGERLYDLLPIHCSDAVQGAFRDEDASTAESGGGLRDGNGAKTGRVADEPKAVQEALGFDRPRRSIEGVHRSEVLGQRAEIGVVAGIGGVRRPPGNRLSSRMVVATESELVEELAYGVVEVFAGANAIRDTRQGLG